MVFRFEESIAAVCAPSPDTQADLRMCQAVFDSRRYLVYAIESLLVILVETPSVSTTSRATTRDQAQYASKFELWQAWNAPELIKCVRYNPSNKAACGAFALCIEEGCGVLLMPASATSTRSAAVVTTTSASNLDDNGKLQHVVTLDNEWIPEVDYVKTHLNFHLSRWADSVRWKCDDRLLHHLEWMEREDDVFLLGVGYNLSIWKLVDDAVQIYLQRTIALSGCEQVPVVLACHFDVASSGRFAATAGMHDRIVKVWNVKELSPHEGTPMSLFLAHSRALVCMTWSKKTNVYNARLSVSTTTHACEMLFALDRSGHISIWRENLALMPSFVLWKRFAAPGNCSSSIYENDATLGIRMRMFGLIDHCSSRETPKPVLTINEALLSENTMMDALCLLYGYSSLNEARRNKLTSHQMDSTTHINTKLFRDRCDAVADAHVGEAFICGNIALEQAFDVHLIYGVLRNGDFCIFRVASTLFTGSSPRLSLLFCYSGLQKELIDAHIYNVSSFDYQDHKNGSRVFFIELLFQQKTGESYLQSARLKLEAENALAEASQKSVLYTVLSCNISVICSSMMSAVKEEDARSASFSVAKLVPWYQPVWHADSIGPAVKVVTINMGGRFNIFRASESLHKLENTFRPANANAIGPVTHVASYEKRSVLYLVTGGRLHVGTVAHGSIHQEKVISHSSVILSGRQVNPRLFVPEPDDLTLSICCADGGECTEMIDKLISVVVPESVKIKWSNSTTCFSESAMSKPTKDYNMVVGMHKGGKKLTIWIFSFESTVLQMLASSVQLFRKTTVDLPEARLVSVTTVPLLDTFEITLASFDAHLQLTLWTFADIDDVLEMRPVHRVDVDELIRTAARAQTSHKECYTPEQRLVFKHFSFSICGHVAILLGGGDSRCEDKICFLSTMESAMEDVVKISHRQLGQVVTLEWTPPATPGCTCELLFLSTTTIAMLKSESSRPVKKWSIVWSFSRFNMRPEKIFVRSSYPYSLLCTGSSLVHLNLQETVGVRSSLLQMPAKQNSPLSKFFPAHHPVILMYLLARGSFETLENVLEHVKTKVLEHEEMCYLRMTDDTVLQTLPLLSLSQLLGDPMSTENKRDERSDVYLRGKVRKRFGGTSRCAVSEAPARASDLFAMDVATLRCSEASRNGIDRADMLFVLSFSHNVSEHKPTTSLKSKLETDVFPTFFSKHKGSLTFMTTEELNIFLTIVTGVKKVVSWERDSSRQKDEAALRFYASLLWPTNHPASIQPGSADSDALEEQTVSKATALTSNCLGTRGLCSEQIVWGALSDYQSELLQECFPAAIMSWEEMKRLRLPFWLRSSTKLIQFAEKVAQVEYATNRDPFAVAVFYVLLGKTRLLASLFKLANESRISDLLSSNFSDSRWTNAAIKNAYVLKTKQRYELSAAFFLLGGKVTEAVSVAEQADATLVLSFLIARISEKYDLVQDEALCNPGIANLSPKTFAHLTTRFCDPVEASSAASVDNELSETKQMCVDFLRTTVYEKAVLHGDIYMRFLVKYLLRETNDAIDILVTPPTSDMECMFGDSDNSSMDSSSMYWSAFGKSLLGACNLVSFLRKTLLPMKLTVKAKVLRLNTLAMLRMQDTGLDIAALLHQHDIASFVQELRQEYATSSDVAAFLGHRQRVLVAAIGGQVEFLYTSFVHSMREAMRMPATSESSKLFDLEDRLNNEIQCIVRHGGDYNLPGVPETSKTHLEHRVRAAVVKSFIRSGRLAALDVLVSRWSHSEDLLATVAFASPLPRLVEAIAEGVATVASGDLMSAAISVSHIRKVDQTCSNLLVTAIQLLLWLQSFYSKPLEEKAALPNRELERVAVAAVHSAICICCRYLKHPCCLYRVLVLVFPRKDGLSSNTEEAVDDIAESDFCLSCASIRRSKTASGQTLDASSFQQDIPVLYQAVQILELELDEFMTAVKTSRLHRPMPSHDLPTPKFSYCSYRELVLTMAAGAMPTHLFDIAGEDVVSTSTLSNKLIDAWEDYSKRLASFALKHLLCDLAGFFFRSSSIAHPATSDVALTGRPSSPAQHSFPGSPCALNPDILESSPSALPFGHSSRQLLKCECERCPWLLSVKPFADKNDLLLRLNAQLESCSKKIGGEVWWGRLHEPVVRESALTRSQNLLFPAAAKNPLTLLRATNDTDQSKRCMAPTATSTTVHVQCVYRSETPIKAICLNRVNGDDAEMSACTSKGIFRASCMDYADARRFQFKGMYAEPQNSAFFPPDSTISSPMKYRQTTPDAMRSSNCGSSRQHLLSPSSTTRVNDSRSPLQNAVHLLASPSELKPASFKPTTVTAHPFLPLFVSGNRKGHVHLWSYDRLSALCAFQSKDVVAPYPASPSMLSGWKSIGALEFDSLGQQLGAVDAGGHLFLWKFSQLDRVPYYREIMCHDKGAKRLAFLNSSSTIVTAGLSSEKKSVCVWDTLLPTSKALIAAPTCHPAGATSVAFSSAHQLLITGGAGGAMSIFDMRQRRVLHTISNAHETPIKTLVLDPSGDRVLSGSASGDVKIWSLPLFQEVAFVSKVHVKPSFLSDAASNLLGDAASNVAINVTNSSWGVTDAVATKDAFYTSGADGLVQRLTLPLLRTRL